MKRHEVKRTLGGADPVDRKQVDGLDLEGMEADLMADLEGVPSGLSEPARKERRPRRLALALGVAALASATLAFLVLAGRGDEPSSRAYGAELVRFAESTPLLLLEGPGWRVQNVTQNGRGEGGTMEFVTGKPVPYETVWVTGNSKTGQRARGMLPPAVRQRKVELAWRPGTLEEALAIARGIPHPHGQLWVELPVLETTAHVDARAEFFVNQGGPGNRQMTAIWPEGDNVLELRAAVPDLAAFEERLDWLTQVDSQTWLDAMPAKVVKAADHDAAVREMLKGIPTPEGFEPSQVRDLGLTTSRYQVGAAVTGTVSCLWFLQWGEARRSGDEAAVAEAVNAMTTSKRWPILHEMAKDGAYPETIWQLAEDMPSGYWDWRGHHRPLLPRAEGLGCARWGMPLLPWKQERQRERRTD